MLVPDSTVHAYFKQHCRFNADNYQESLGGPSDICSRTNKACALGSCPIIARMIDESITEVEEFIFKEVSVYETL